VCALQSGSVTVGMNHTRTAGSFDGGGERDVGDVGERSSARDAKR